MVRDELVAVGGDADSGIASLHEVPPWYQS
jgi:hypothetical protein